MIYTLIDKAIKLSSPQFHNSNVKIVEKILIENAYPTKFIKTHVKNRLKSINNNTSSREIANNNPNEVLDAPKYLTLPFYNDSSISLAKKLKKHNIRTVFTINNKLNGIIKKGKDKLKKENNMHIVYQINCKNCKECYIGQSDRTLKTRIDKHKDNILKDPKYHTIITSHRIEKDHEFDWKGTIIRDKETNWSKRLTSEMIEIKNNNNTINLQKDSAKLSDVYLPLIK